MDLAVEMSLVIRPAIAADLKMSVELLSEAGLPTADLDANSLALIAERNETFCGAIGLEAYGEIALLRSLVVARGARGGGVGPALVTALETQCHVAGVNELWLLTIDADGFFFRLGYQTRDRADAPESIRNTREFSGLCPDDAVLMSKSLLI